jgi:hypothetical protein
MTDIVAKVCGQGGSDFFRAVEAPFEKNMWGSTQPTAHVTRGSPSRTTMPLNSAFSLRRL